METILEGETFQENKGRLDMELNTKMIGHCKLGAQKVWTICHILSKEDVKHNVTMDKYEYTENCPDYSGIKVIE